MKSLGFSQKFRQRFLLKIGLFKVLLENGWNSKRMITEGDTAIPLETTRRAFPNQEKSKQRSAIVPRASLTQKYVGTLLHLLQRNQSSQSLWQYLYTYCYVQTFLGVCNNKSFADKTKNNAPESRLTSYLILPLRNKELLT